MDDQNFMCIQWVVRVINANMNGLQTNVNYRRLIVCVIKTHIIRKWCTFQFNKASWDFFRFFSCKCHSKIFIIKYSAIFISKVKETRWLILNFIFLARNNNSINENPQNLKYNFKIITFSYIFQTSLFYFLRNKA